MNALLELRQRYDRIMADVRLLPIEKEFCLIEATGSPDRPQTVGHAKRALCLLESALTRATTEVPF